MVDELAEQLSEIVVTDEYKRVRSERRDKWRQFCQSNQLETSENEVSMNEPHLHVVAACLLLVRWLCCLKHMKTSRHLMIPLRQTLNKIQGFLIGTWPITKKYKNVSQALKNKNKN